MAAVTIIHLTLLDPGGGGGGGGGAVISARIVFILQFITFFNTITILKFPDFSQICVTFMRTNEIPDHPRGEGKQKVA